jgi:transposase-like protein
MIHPKFCPNPDCIHHETEATTNKKWFFLHGSHINKIYGTIKRYVCKNCGRTFSSQTFSPTRYAKIFVDFPTATKLLEMGLSLRKTAKIMGLNHKVVTRRQKKLLPSAPNA